MTDPSAGVAEMRRVTRPGGTVTGAVWDCAGEMTLLRRFWDAAVALDPAAAERDELGVAPSGAYAAALPPGRRAALRDELRRRLGVGGEPFELTARAWVATGRAG